MLSQPLKDRASRAVTHMRWFAHEPEVRTRWPQLAEFFTRLAPVILAAEREALYEFDEAATLEQDMVFEQKILARIRDLLERPAERLDALVANMTERPFRVPKTIAEANARVARLEREIVDISTEIEVRTFEADQRWRKAVNVEEWSARAKLARSARYDELRTLREWFRVIANSKDRDARTTAIEKECANLRAQKEALRVENQRLTVVLNAIRGDVPLPPPPPPPPGPKPDYITKAMHHEVVRKAEGRLLRALRSQRLSDEVDTPEMLSVEADLLAGLAPETRDAYVKEMIDALHAKNPPALRTITRVVAHVEGGASSYEFEVDLRAPLPPMPRPRGGFNSVKRKLYKLVQWTNEHLGHYLPPSADG